ncbi:MAG: TonB-dependent receptor, partial [Ferruginibacter sp.]
MDKEVEKDEKRFAASTNTLFASQNGYYALNSQDTRQIYADGIVSINKTFVNKYNVTANIGSSIEDVSYNQYMYGGKLAGVANLYTFANVNTSTAENSQSGYHKQKQSAFASASFGYKNMLFLDGTARNDWASSLIALSSKSFFYPSVGLSGVLTDLLHIKSDKLPYLKIRGSYSEVGNEPVQFLNIPTYPLSGGYPVVGGSTPLPNPTLKPELTKSWEIGLNASFFKGALRLDGTIYSSRTYNQFFQPTLSSGVGAQSIIVNAGRVDNKGLELGAKYDKKFGSVSWNTYVNYSLNVNTVVQLLPGFTDPTTNQLVALHLSQIDMSGTGSYKMVLTEGSSMGDIYVNTLRVDEHGAIYVDPGSKTVTAEANKFVYAGNNNPKYTASWGNNIKWKGINLGFQFNARVGGIVVSNTQAMMDAFGVSQASAEARDNGGVLVNGYKVPAKEYYQIVGAGASGGIASMYVYSATNVRLAEASLGYDIPVKKWLKWVKTANVSLVGRNLLFLYNKAPFDPELTANTQTYYQGIDYFMAPSQRSIGFSVKLNF